MEEKKYKNNLFIIGKKTKEIQEKLDLSKDDKTEKLENYWNIILPENEIEETISEYDYIVQKSVDNPKIIFSFTIIFLIYSFKEDTQKSIRNLFDGIMNVNDNNYYFPFVIFLTMKKNEKTALENFINKQIKENLSFDKRNFSFFISPLSGEASPNESILIRKKINEIFSYFYGLGDNFIINNKEYKLYKEIEIKDKIEEYPFNILLLGKTQSGKSTLTNTLLKKKISREGGAGTSETSGKISFHIDNLPLTIYDIEGFNSRSTITEAISIIQDMQTSFKERELHLVIYVTSYEHNPFFLDDEYEVFKQLSKKFDKSKILFLCTKTVTIDEKKLERKFKEIKRSFRSMIQKGLEHDKDSQFNVLQYLYSCQKGEIKYEEIYSEEDEVKRKEFEEKNEYEKLKLKIETMKNEDIEEEMYSAIIKKNETLFFTNLKIDEKYHQIFGINNVARKISEIIREIENDNIRHLKNSLKETKNEKNELIKQIEEIKQQEKEYNKEIIKFIKEEEHPLIDNDVLDSKLNELKNKENLFKNFEEMIEEIEKKEKNDLDSIKVKVDKIAEEKEKLSKEVIFWDKFWGSASGVVPVIDLIVQHYKKISAHKKIAKIFGEDFIDVKSLYESFQKEEKENITKVKKETSDIPSDITKTTARFGTVSTNILTKVTNIGVNMIGRGLTCALAGIGVTIGVGIGAYAMSHDTNALIDFYKARFYQRVLANLSFDSVEKYFKETSFEE